MNVRPIMDGREQPAKQEDGPDIAAAGWRQRSKERKKKEKEKGCDDGESGRGRVCLVPCACSWRVNARVRVSECEGRLAQVTAERQSRFTRRQVVSQRIHK